MRRLTDEQLDQLQAAADKDGGFLPYSLWVDGTEKIPKGRIDSDTPPLPADYFIERAKDGRFKCGCLFGYAVTLGLLPIEELEEKTEYGYALRMHNSDNQFGISILEADDIIIKAGLDLKMYEVEYTRVPAAAVIAEYKSRTTQDSTPAEDPF